ncbi:MAG: 5-carboxymethyl-2-hydroxymuconate Delta-isomerase [Alcaligenaceae bacterium]|nr:5-carboxymethyl-2-hydroxymuconate Delta-isomerase [Alcaligenaceae bacterium]
MPHLVLYYTANLEHDIDIPPLCRALADTMLEIRDENGAAVFPVGGVRVLAYPAAHHAVADGGKAGLEQAHAFSHGAGDYAFIYLNLRMGRGRSAQTHQRIGTALETTLKNTFTPLLEKRPIGVTFQIDEGPEVFDMKLSSLHPLFKKGS